MPMAQHAQGNEPWCTEGCGWRARRDGLRGELGDLRIIKVGRTTVILGMDAVGTGCRLDLMLPKVFSKLYDFYWCQHPAPTQEDPTFLHLSIKVFTPKTNWESNAQLRAALPPPAPPTPSPAHSSHTRGSASRELGVVSLTVRSSGGETVLWGPMVGGGRWYSLDWSCCADGQGRVSRTHSTGSSQAAFCPWTCRQGAREVAPAHQTFTPPQVVPAQPRCHQL